jgi:hypothetical protein
LGYDTVGALGERPKQCDEHNARDLGFSPKHIPERLCVKGFSPKTPTKHPGHHNVQDWGYAVGALGERPKQCDEHNARDLGFRPKPLPERLYVKGFSPETHTKQRDHRNVQDWGYAVGALGERPKQCDEHNAQDLGFRPKPLPERLCVKGFSPKTPTSRAAPLWCW